MPKVATHGQRNTKINQIREGKLEGERDEERPIKETSITLQKFNNDSIMNK
jgi:hypothetical protein